MHTFSSFSFPIYPSSHVNAYTAVPQFFSLFSFLSLFYLIDFFLFFQLVSIGLLSVCLCVDQKRFPCLIDLHVCEASASASASASGVLSGRLVPFAL